jgi:hypothetical protein
MSQGQLNKPNNFTVLGITAGRPTQGRELKTF